MAGPPRPSRPAARYRPGKAPLAGAVDEYDSDQSSSSSLSSRKDDSNRQESISDFNSSSAAKPIHNESRRTAGVVVNIPSAPSAASPPQDKEYDSDEYETDTDEEEQVVDQKPVFAKPPSPTEAVKRDEDEESESESGTSDEGSEEESEEEQKPMFKPMFISRKQRQGQTDGSTSEATSSTPHPSSSTAGDLQARLEAEAKAEEALRRKEAQKLASDRIKLELLEKQASENKPDLDDTDGLDPEGEFQAWRLRELSRIQRSLQAEIEREQEEADRTKRDAMTESERLRLDTRLADETRARKAQDRQNNQPGYMQKYYHKGAFFQDLDILKKRDYSQATESAVDVKSLPSIMQVRDFGKRGRTKWTHLANEDTSKSAISLKAGRTASSQSKDTGCFQCGSEDHRKADCPHAHQDQFKRRRVDEHRTSDQGWAGRQR